MPIQKCHIASRLKGYARETHAVFKSPIPNAGHAIREGHAHKTSAFIKSAIQMLVTLSGTDTFVRLEQPLKAPSAIFVTLSGMV